MRYIITIVLCLTLMIGCATPCTATTEEKILCCREEYLGDGLLMKETVLMVDTNLRGTSTTASKYREYTYNGKLIAYIEISATFNYNGSTVSVLSKSVSKCETYEGWSFKQSALTSNGGTVSLTGNLKKLLVLNASVEISITCDKNGNIS